MPINPRANFIPLSKSGQKSKLPTTIASSVKTPPIYKKPISTQTDKLLFIKEETLVLSFARIGVNDGGMRRDYLKAVNYINSCHKFINTILEKNCTDKNNLFVLPTITNFIPMFPNLLSSKKPATGVRSAEVRKSSTLRDDRRSLDSCLVRPKYEERKSSRKLARKVKKHDSSSHYSQYRGDLSPKSDDQDYEDREPVQHITDSVKQQLNQFLCNLQEDFFMNKNKAAEISSSQPIQKHFFKQSNNFDKNLHLNSNSVDINPSSPPPRSYKSDDCSPSSAVYSEYDGAISKSKPHLKITTYDSASTVSSNTSDIVSDSDAEINI